MKASRLILAVPAALIALAWGTPVIGDVTVKNFKETKSEGGANWRLTQVVVFSAGQAYEMANGQLAAQHRSLLYCQPSHLTLTVDNYVDIAEKQIVRWHGLFPEETPIVSALLYGLEYSFPCQQ